MDYSPLIKAKGVFNELTVYPNRLEINSFGFLSSFNKEKSLQIPIADILEIKTYNEGESLVFEVDYKNAPELKHKNLGLNYILYRAKPETQLAFALAKEIISAIRERGYNSSEIEELLKKDLSQVETIQVPKPNFLKASFKGLLIGGFVVLVFMGIYTWVNKKPSACDCEKLTTEGVLWSVIGYKAFEREYGYEFDQSAHIECLEVWEAYMKRQAKINGNALSKHPEYINPSAYFDDACNHKIDY